MLLVRAPLRISIAGGGTDLPSYYEKFGGSWISAAIDQYIFIGIKPSFNDEYILRYSETERVKSIGAIKHNLIREVLKLHDMPPIELVSLADAPAGTGLGSSGTFTVSLLRAIYAFKRMYVTPQDLAEEAFNVEKWILNEPCGKQDQYIAAFGGLTCFDVDQAGAVRTYPLHIQPKVLSRLEDNLLMFFTGFTRSSTEMLAEQVTRSEAGDQKMLEDLHFVRELGVKIKQALLAGDLRAFGALMHEHWLRKRERSQGMSNAQIDTWYERARQNGAVGGKLVGAGGGGFLLFYTEEPERLRVAMPEAGLNEVRFNFDYDGPTVVLRN